MTENGAPLVIFYDDRLVALSIFIAISASYTALDLGGRVAAARGRIRSAWLAGGAAALGLGIWSMHFIGMQAFNFPVPVLYDWPTVLVSLLAAIFASAAALYVVSRKKMGCGQTLTGTVFMGLGMEGMHYIGIAAMRLPAVSDYSRPLVAVSALIAGIASLIVLVFTFDYREDSKGAPLAKVISAVVMGAAICLAHYTGMWSASFFPCNVLPNLTHAVGISSFGLGGIVIGTFMIQGAALVTSSMDRRFTKQAQELKTNEYFHQIADNLQIVLALTNADFTKVLYVNRTFQDIWGRKVGSFYRDPASLLESIHPDDCELVEEGARCLLSGGPIDNLEFRVVRPDGSTSWVTCRGYPILDAQGHVYRIAGCAQNISQRKVGEEDLRRISNHLLRLQDEERRRISRDLHDSTGQDLVALATMLGQLNDTLPSAERKSRALLSECQELVAQCIREVRTLAYVLHPPALDDAGLEEAIRDYTNGFTKRSGIHVELEMSTNLERLARDIEVALFRVVQESLTNIQRHSGKQEAKIRIDRGSNLILEISDRDQGSLDKNPLGSDVFKFEVGVGILSMQERVKSIGGRLDIEPSAHGTTVRVTVPLGGEEREKSAHSDCG